ncbi:MAG: SAM-dependent methyltransferase [Acetatifactor sp.]|nr:SAM-dependent methyltransferase [Acetatifactor sp.]
MEELRKLLSKIYNENLVKGTLSYSVDQSLGSKCRIRPVKIKDSIYIQTENFRDNKAYHENLDFSEAVEKTIYYMTEVYRQAQIETTDREITVLVSKKGKVTITNKAKKIHGVSAKKINESLQKIIDSDSENNVPEPNVLSHNRKKEYILQEGAPVDFLVELGVQTPDGKITKNRYDKFRQINRYLEFIEDVLDSLPNDKTVRIIDFGCGKSYLTFAMYYYLKVLQGRDIDVTGLDLKKDVITHCNELAEKLHYDNLHFEIGNIKDYTGADSVDMVVSLHACDLATDYALEKAVKWGAKVIMAVPCCQHEVNRQIKNPDLKGVLQYGYIKERLSALITDAVRADLLKEQGYDTQILEFIDMEHTPKNILIRAVKKPGMRKKSDRTDVEKVCEIFNINPTLKKLLEEQN